MGTRDLKGVLDEVTKEDDHYNIAVSTVAHVMLRLDKVVRAAPQRPCACTAPKPGIVKHETDPYPPQLLITDTEIGPITLCQLLCFDFEIAKGFKIPVCVPVNCRVLRPGE